MSHLNLTKPMLGELPNMAHPLAKGMIGCWLFNEPQGLLDTSMSIYSQDLSNSGGDWDSLVANPPTYLGTEDGKVLYLHSTTRPLYQTDYPDWDNITDSITIEFRGRLNGSLVNNYPMLSKWGGSKEFVIVSISGTLYWATYTTGQNNMTLTPPGTADDTLWHLFCIKDGSNKYIYYGDTLKKSGTHSGNFASTSEPLTLGNYGSAYTAAQNIDVHYIRIWNRGLNQSEITELVRDPWDMFTRPSYRFAYDLPAAAAGGIPPFIYRPQYHGVQNV